MLKWPTVVAKVADHCMVIMVLYIFKGFVLCLAMRTASDFDLNSFKTLNESLHERNFSQECTYSTVYIFYTDCCVCIRVHLVEEM